MLLLPHDGDIKAIDNTGIVGSGNIGTSVSADAASTSTYGTVVELISAASNVQASWGIGISCGNIGGSAIASDSMVDILIGGATDDVLIPGLLAGYSERTSFWFFPIYIPSGVRIAARCMSRALSGSGSFRVGCWLYGGSNPPFRVGRKVTTYGLGTPPTYGTAVTPATSGGAATATQMTASTSEDHFAFLPSFQTVNDTTIATSTGVNIGIGVGASTEERIGTWWYSKNATEFMHGPMPPIPAFRDVPSGTRLTILASNGGTNDSGYQAAIHAVS